jgi:thymidylate synthase (FAD)
MNEPNGVMSKALTGGGPALARELARMNLPVNYYTQFYWKIDLHNLMHFLSLRADNHAQYEIRAYADTMMDTVQRWVPAACGAFADYRLGAVQLSALAVVIVQRLIRGEHVRRSETGLSAREWRELSDSLDLPADRMLDE